MRGSCKHGALFARLRVNVFVAKHERISEIMINNTMMLGTSLVQMFTGTFSLTDIARNTLFLSSGEESAVELQLKYAI